MATNFQLNVKINGVDTAVSTVGQLEAALAATKDELKDIQIGSTAFDSLSKQARTLQGELELNGEKLTNFNGNLDNITQSVGRLGSTIASGFAVATSAIGLFSGESEDLTKAQVQAQQALTLAFGATTIATNAARLNQDLKNIADAIGLNLTRSRIASEATHTASLGAETAATGVATVAQRGFNAAVAANPLGLLLVALTAVVGAIILFSDAEDESAKKSDLATKAYLEQIKAQREHETVIQDLLKSKAELLILEEQDAEKRIALTRELYGILDEEQAQSLEKQGTNLKFALERSLEEYEKINKDFLTVTQKTNEVIDFYTVRTADGFEQRAVYATKEVLLNQSVIDSANTLYETKQLLLLKELEGEDERLYTQEVVNLKFQQLETEHYLKLLDRQETYLKAQGLLDDEAVKERFETLRANLTESLNGIEKNIEDQIKFNDSKNKKILEDDEKAREKAKADLEKRQADWKRAYDAIKKTVEDAYTTIEDIEDDYFDKINELEADSAADRLELEKILELQRIEAIRRKFLAELDADKTLGKEKSKIIQEYDIEYKEAQDRLNEYYQIRIDEEIRLENEKTASLKLIRDLLDKEIFVGDQNALDNLENLKIREKQLRISALEAELEYNRLSIKQIKAIELEKLQLIKQSLEDQKAIEIQNAEAEQQRQIAELRKFYADQTDLTEEQQKIAAEIIEKAETNSQLELNTKKAEINEKYRKEELAADKESAEATKNILLDKINFYADYVFQLSNLITGLVASVNELNAVESENRLNALRDETAQQTSILNEGYNEQVALLEDKFNRGQISQEQYNNSINDLNRNLSKNTLELDRKQKEVELKEKKKAFESDKKLKIAQAIIAGAQGALQAFTGAMQLGPIAGPIVGGILAGIVGVTTGIQVAAIKKTKFDGGAPDITPPSTPQGVSGGGVGGADAISQYAGGGNTQFSSGLMGPPPGSQGFTGGSGAPGGTRVYVVESDITNSQNKVKVLEGGSSFG